MIIYLRYHSLPPPPFFPVQDKQTDFLNYISRFIFVVLLFYYIW